MPVTDRQQRIHAHNYVQRHMSQDKPRFCWVCGQEKKLDGHHLFGYTHPREIVWLCRRCHARAEGRGRNRDRDDKGRFLPVEDKGAKVNHEAS